MRRATSRRAFVQKAALLPLLPLADVRSAQGQQRRTSKLKLSCNLYSFNEPLRSGAMTLEEAVDFCAALGFDAVDPTAYYFAGYPETPPMADVHRIKQRAFLQGLAISGTGVRNDFTVPDEEQRAADVALVRRWTDVASALGAPFLRVFAGHALPEGYAEEEMFEWVVEGVAACVAYGEERGVMIVLQNHNALLRTSADVLRLRERIPSDWFGLNVDIGSLRTGDPYEEVARLAPHAYTWQIKENVYRSGQEEKTDVKRIVQIAREAGYRGYLPLETLGPGDPKEKLPRFLDEVREALA